jgi:hypothetical protein
MESDLRLSLIRESSSLLTDSRIYIGDFAICQASSSNAAFVPRASSLSTGGAKDSAFPSFPSKYGFQEQPSPPCAECDEEPIICTIDENRFMKRKS